MSSLNKPDTHLNYGREDEMRSLQNGGFRGRC